MNVSISGFGFLAGYVALVGESIGWMKAAGIALTVAGVALLSWQQE